MKVKEINRTAILSWSPAQHHPIYLATGTSAQQLDASFSTSASLELFEFNLADPSLDMKSCGTLSSSHRYHKLVWSPFGIDGQGLASGVLIAGGENGNVILYDPVKILSGDTDVIIAESNIHTGPVRALDVNPFQTNLVASGGNESEIYIWDINNFGSPMTPGPKTQPLEDISCVAWNRQVQHILASASPSGRTSVWDLRKNDLIIKVSDHSNRMHCSGMAWNPEVATQLVMASEDDRMPVIQMWDLRFASSPLKILGNHTRGVLAIAWSYADPELLLSCGKDGRILCWNPNTAEILYELPTGNQWCFDIQWCPRNPAVLSAAGFNSCINIYSIMGGTSQAQSHVDQISNSFGNMDPFGTGQTLPPLELPQSGTFSTTVNPIKKPPKWIQRPVGAAFAFGGKLVSLENGKPNPQQPNRHVVHVSQVVTETDLLKRSSQLQDTISSGQFVEFCQGKINMAENEFEKTVWSFLKANFDSDTRSTFLELLGYNKDELALKISAALTEKPTEMDFPPQCDVQSVADLNTVTAADDPEAAFDLIAAANLQPSVTQEMDSAPPTESEETLEVNAEEKSADHNYEIVDHNQVANGIPEQQWYEEIILDKEVNDVLDAREDVLQASMEETTPEPVSAVQAPSKEPSQDLFPDIQAPNEKPSQDLFPDIQAPNEKPSQDLFPDIQAPNEEPSQDLFSNIQASSEQPLDPFSNIQAPSEEPSQDPFSNIQAPSEEPSQDLFSNIQAPSEEPSQDLFSNIQAPSEEPAQDLFSNIQAPSEEPSQDPFSNIQAPNEKPSQDLFPDIQAPNEEPSQDLFSNIQASSEQPLDPFSNIQAPSEEPSQDPFSNIQAPSEEPAQDLFSNIQAPSEEPSQDPFSNIQAPSEEPSQDLFSNIQAPSEEPSQDPFSNIQAPSEEPSQDPFSNIQAPSEEPSQDPFSDIQAPSEEPSQDPFSNIQAPSEEPSQDPFSDIQAPSEEPSQDPFSNIQAPSEEPSQDPFSDIQAPSEEPSQDLFSNIQAPSEEPSQDPFSNIQAPSEEPSHNPFSDIQAPSEEPSHNPFSDIQAPSEEPSHNPFSDIQALSEESSQDPFEKVFQASSEQLLIGEVLKAPEDGASQVIASVVNPNLGINRDVDRLITQALLTGDFEGAVELCLLDNRMADSIILAIAGGAELLEKTQKKYFIKSQSKLTKLISAVVMKDLHDILSTCDLQNWKEAMAAVMTYAQTQEFSSLCDLLGGRLEGANDPKLQAQACLCYICAGNLEKLVSCWIKAQEGNDPLSLQDLVEKVVVMRHAVEQTQNMGPLAVGDLLAKKMSEYANLLASQGCLTTAITYLPSETSHVCIQLLRERLSHALGQQDPASFKTQSTPSQVPPLQIPTAAQSNNPYSIVQPTTTAPAHLQYYQPVRAASTVTSWSNQTPTAFPHVPPSLPVGTASDPSKVNPSSPMCAIPTAGTAAAPSASSAPFIHSHQYQNYAQVNQYPQGAGALTEYRTHQDCPPVVPLLAEASVAPHPPGFLSHYSQPVPFQAAYAPSPLSSQCPSFSSSSNPPLFPKTSTSTPRAVSPSSVGSFQHGGPGSPGSYMLLPPQSGVSGTQHDSGPELIPASQRTGPQNGWNDPPTLSRGPKKKLVPEHYTPPAPITAPIMAPLGVNLQPQQMPSGSPQIINQIPHAVQTPYSGMQQPLAPSSLNSMNTTMPKTSSEGAPGAPIGDVIQPPRSMTAEKITKKPIPDEHFVLKTTFEGLIQKCLIVATDPQTKRKLDDANKRLETLYDKLREHTLSPAIIGGLHNIARTIESRSYAEGLNIHTHIVSSSNFSEISGFMPVLKVVLTQANKLGV